jgi:hypothetical protein
MLDFSDLTIQEEQVTAPDKKVYTLREANGKAATDHRNAIMASTQFGPDGKVTGVKNLASVEAVFVAACLWDEKNRNPTVVTVSSWPARVQKALYEKAKELSDMGEESPIVKQLEKALNLEDSPIAYQQLSEFVATLPSEGFSSLVSAFKVRDKDAETKNS